MVLFRVDWISDLVNSGGDPTKADSDVEQAIVINDSVVMIRERAKAGAGEILWPVEDIPAGQKVVNVAWGDR